MDLREVRAAPPGSVRRHPWEQARLEIVQQLLSNGLSKAPDTILDVGCGDGFVVEALSRRYPSARCIGVDTGLTGGELVTLRDRLGQEVQLHRSLAEAAAAHGRPADVVLLLDVLEHVEDDEGLLARLRRSPLVGAGTLLLVTVPAHQRLFGSHDLFLRHYRRYDQRMLAEHLARAGFRVERAGEFFLLPFVLRAVQTARERWRRTTEGDVTGAAGWTGGPLLTRLTTSGLLLDFACSQALRRLGIALPGLSSYALCRTPVS